MSNIYGYTYNDMNTLAKYATGASINVGALELTSGVGGFLVFDGLMKGGSWLYKNKTNFKTDGFKKTVANSIKEQKAFEQSMKGKNLFETTKNFANHNTLTELAGKYQEFQKLQSAEVSKMSAKAQAKYMNKLTKSGYYNDVRRLISEAKNLKGSAYTSKMKEVYEAISKADLAVHNAKLAGEMAPVSKLGKFMQKGKNLTGITKLSGSAKSLAATSKTFRTVGRFAKGNALFAGISLLAETPEIIQTYGELGAKKGNKQLAKTIGNVAAETIAFTVGMKAGAAMGAAIGTCIPIPVVGTVVGAVLGAAVGFAASWLAGRATRKIWGESELQEDKTYKANVIEAKFKPKTEQQLLAVAQQRLEQEKDMPTEDTMAAKASFDRVITKYQQA